MVEQLEWDSRGQHWEARSKKQPNHLYRIYVESDGHFNICWSDQELIKKKSVFAMLCLAKAACQEAEHIADKPTTAQPELQVNQSLLARLVSGCSVVAFVVMTIQCVIEFNK